ncbi:MAG: UDP-N-acetylglucosamine 1-carboxyvinyltransferase [Candidatus Riflebacteria bacterium RBG_13_59_9]|nr:MAG: UDP-N-acetylglucosamine 1-carboxyvinyltransferase [Candidatus Riflebacteria bacterium RBG_13_59_9]
MLVAGGKPLQGEVAISGAKNSALPLICASILADSPVVLDNVPLLDDVRSICEVLESLGARCEFAGGRLTIDPTSIFSQSAPYELVRKMRASFLVMGPLLAKFGRGDIPLPGGCNIGPRPVNEHLRAFAELGAEIEFKKGVVHARADSLRGAAVNFDITSVGATENLLMAAALADGVTTLENCAEEPEVEDLVNLLRSLGADIRMSGPRHIEVRGVDSLRQSEPYTIIPDRIEAGTYLLAGVGTRGHVRVAGCQPKHISALLDKVREMGAEVEAGDNWLEVAPAQKLTPANVRTQPYPGFATDLQPQMTTVLTRTNGVSLVTETVFEQRFSYVPELQRMGASVHQQENTVVVDGAKSRLMGAPVEGYDLRGFAALSIAAMMAHGESLIAGYNHLARGYENFVGKLLGLGAELKLVDRNYPLKNNHKNPR